MSTTVKYREHTVTPEQIRTAWSAIQAGRNPLSAKQSALSSYVQSEWRGSYVNDFVGCSGEQMNGWLSEGYYVESGDMPALSQSDAVVGRRKRRWSDENGEMVWDRVMDNEEKWMVTRERQPQKRGLKIRACFDFNCGVKASMMADYFAWILRIIDRAERQGITPDVELFIETVGSFQGESGQQARLDRHSGRQGGRVGGHGRMASVSDQGRLPHAGLPVAGHRRRRHGQGAGGLAGLCHGQQVGRHDDRGPHADDPRPG